MKVANRRKTILDLVLSGTVNVDALCKQVNVSEATMRRDLSALAEQGFIVRTYGGAAHVGLREPESSVDERRQQHSQQKLAIARAALAHIRDNDTLFLDAGTTTCALAELLDARQGLHVITNNVLALTALSKLPSGKITLLGGELRNSSLSTFGAAAQAALEHLSADKVFLSADGVVADLGLCEASAEQAYLKTNMMARAAQVFVLADATKLGRASQQHWSPVKVPWTLVTDASADDTLLRPFRQARNVVIEVAGC